MAVVHIVHHRCVAVRSGAGPLCALFLAACVRRGCPARRRRAGGLLRGDGLRFSPASPSKSPSYALRESLRSMGTEKYPKMRSLLFGGLALQGPAETSPRPADTSSGASDRCLAFSRRHRVGGGCFLLQFLLHREAVRLHFREVLRHQCFGVRVSGVASRVANSGFHMSAAERPALEEASQLVEKYPDSVSSTAWVDALDYASYKYVVNLPVVRRGVELFSRRRRRGERARGRHRRRR